MLEIENVLRKDIEMQPTSIVFKPTIHDSQLPIRSRNCHQSIGWFCVDDLPMAQAFCVEFEVFRSDPFLTKLHTITR